MSVYPTVLDSPLLPKVFGPKSVRVIILIWLVLGLLPWHEISITLRR